jgi:hypothetical protein
MEYSKFNSILFLSFIWILVSCTQMNSQNFKTFSISKKDNVYTLFYYEDSLIHIDKLVITCENCEKKEMLLQLNKELDFLSDKNLLMQIEDYNFDGHEDVVILSYQGLYNLTYSLWLYNPVNKNYFEYPNFSDIVNPSVINQTKTICSNYHVGLNEFYLIRYKWHQNVLKIVEKYEEFWDDSGHLIHTTISENGEENRQETEIKEPIVSFMECY